MNSIRRGIGAAAACSVLAAAAHADAIAHYKFDESSGTTAADSVGSVDGMLQGAASFVSGGISGNAVSLTRSGNGVVNMGNNFGFASGNFSISFWVKTTTTEPDSLALSKHFAGFENSYLFPIGPTGGGGAAGKANFTNSTFVSGGATSTTTVNDGQWHHIVGVYVAGGTTSIFVDGSPAEAIAASAATITNNVAFLVGGVGAVGSGAPESRYTGLIDDVQIYSNALSNSDVDFLVNNPGQVVPVPASAALLGLGGLLAGRRRR
jgi:hypothetical protein